MVPNDPVERCARCRMNEALYVSATARTGSPATALEPCRCSELAVPALESRAYACAAEVSNTPPSDAELRGTKR